MSCCKCFPLTLPTVFDDSMTYYEEVCKLIRKVNEVIDIINELTIETIYNPIDESLTFCLEDNDWVDIGYKKPEECLLVAFQPLPNNIRKEMECCGGFIHH